MSEAPPDWAELSHRHLWASMAVVRAAFARHAQGQPETGAPSDDETTELGRARVELAAIERALPAPSTLQSLCEVFELSPFERDLLLACACMELDGRFAEECALAQRDGRRNYPTFGLALAALPDATWRALAPTGPLRRFHLLELGGGGGLAHAPLTIDERVLHFLQGSPCVDERLEGLLDLLAALSLDALPPSHRKLAEQVALLWHPRGQRPRPIVQLCGSEPPALRAIAAAGAAAVGLQVSVLCAAELPQVRREREMVLRLTEREAALGARAIYVEVDDADSPEISRAAIAFAESLQCLLFVGSREPLRLRRRAAVKLEVENPTTNEQLALWRDALGPLADGLDGHLERVASQFSLGQLAIYAASLSLAGRDGSTPDLGEVLWEACRSQARPLLDQLAQRLEPTTTWDDLVLPEQQLAILRELALHGRHRAQVYERWGFAGKCTRGNGTSALFSGVSGTGKTMAAEVLARELKLDLYRIDLSQVVSKYIGETEKNLRRVFDAAESGGVLLLFDEADALFGKRTEVKDSHDRYANIEVGYLLQRMEQYRGLAILTTNMKESLDQAFLRRIRFVVQFPFPDVAQRVEIWRKVFPSAAPTDGLDATKLARLHVTGGNIRNIALNAAFLASEERAPVRMHHLLAAAKSECAKLGRQPTGAEVGGWA